MTILELYILGGPQLIAVLRISRIFDNYGLRAMVGRVFFVAWATGPSTQQMVLKYEVKIADYRQQTTNKDIKFALFSYLVHINCHLKKFEIFTELSS